jgi:hypothetical protein
MVMEAPKAAIPARVASSTRTLSSVAVGGTHVRGGEMQRRAAEAGLEDETPDGGVVDPEAKPSAQSVGIIPGRMQLPSGRRSDGVSQLGSGSVDLVSSLPQPVQTTPAARRRTPRRAERMRRR